MDRKEILESGLLELFAMGLLEGTELDVVNTALSNDPLLQEALEQIEYSLFLYAQANAISPNPTIKPLLMAKIDYKERLKQGETPDRIPALNADSKVEDFEQWLGREDMQLNASFEEAQVKIIADESDKMTAIVWLKSGAPPETHTNEHEKFLIVEGTCDLSIGTKVHPLKAGDYLAIPLYISHHVKVTSANPCKIILQRVKV